MAAVRHYRVTQTREVMVTATSPADAVHIGAAAFDEIELPLDEEVWGDTTSRVRATDISAYESLKASAWNPFIDPKWRDKVIPNE